jgi:hypothetical protein
MNPLKKEDRRIMRMWGVKPWAFLFRGGGDGFVE